MFPIADVITGSIEHVLIQDVASPPPAPEFAPGSDTAIFAQRDAHGTQVGHKTIPLDLTNNKDNTCTQACHNQEGCTFWIRATNGEDCWLMKDWQGNFGSFYRRVGFIDNQKHQCEPIDDYIKNLTSTTVPDSKIYWNVKQKLALKKDNSATKCMLQFSAKHIIMNLEDFEIMVKGNMDLRSVNENLSTLWGDFTAFVKADIQIRIQVVNGKWKLMASDFILQELHIGANTGQDGDWWHWITGTAYSAMKYQKTCDDLLPAYASFYVKGNNYKTIYINVIYQDVANKKCCNHCMDDPMCDGFSVERELGGEGKYKNTSVVRKCWLFTNKLYSKNRNGGVKGNHTILTHVDFNNNRVGYFDFPKGLKQRETDLKCQAYCEESAACEMWLTSRDQANPGCWLVRGSYLDNGRMQQYLHDQVTGQVEKRLSKGMQTLVGKLNKYFPPSAEIEAPVTGVGHV